MWRPPVFATASRLWWALPQFGFDRSWDFASTMAHLRSENARYRYYNWFFLWHLTGSLRLHRKFFATESRGFGEDAFHALWFQIFRDFRPRTALEIGVYRGQTLTLWEMLSNTIGLQTEVWGLSPLTSASDSVSEYDTSIDYEKDLIQNYERFGLGRPRVFRQLSTSQAAKAFVLSRTWDLVYVDGSHDEADVLSDVNLARQALDSQGILVMDDASLFSPFKPPRFAFAGHEGPSSVAISSTHMQGFSLIGTCGHNRVFMRD